MLEIMILENFLRKISNKRKQTPMLIQQITKDSFSSMMNICGKKSRINKTKESIFNVTFKQMTYVFVFIYSWRNIRKCKDFLLVAHKESLYFFLSFIQKHYAFALLLPFRWNTFDANKCCVFAFVAFFAMKRWKFLFKWFKIMMKRNEDGIFINVWVNQVTNLFAN